MNGHSGSKQHQETTAKVVPQNQAIPLLGIYPKKLKQVLNNIVNSQSCSVAAALFTITRRWNKLKSPSTGDWTNNMWHIHTNDNHAIIKRNY